MAKEIEKLDNDLAAIRAAQGGEDSLIGSERLTLEDDEPEIESPAPEAAPEGDEEEVEEEVAKKPIQPRSNKGIPAEEFNKVRGEKREAERKLAEKEEAEKKLLETVGNLRKENEKLSANQPLPQSYIDAAKKLGIEDPENVKILADAIATVVGAKSQETISGLEATVKSLQASESERAATFERQQSLTQIESEWKEFIPEIEKEFPQATREQLEQAQKLMSDLAETESYTDKEMGYILWKEGDKFTDIFGPPKRRTMLPSRGRPVSSAPVTKGLPEVGNSRESVGEAMKALNKLKQGGELQDQDTNFI